MLTATPPANARRHSFNEIPSAVEQGRFLIQSLAALGSELPQPDTRFQGLLRRGLFVVGSVATVILIFLPTLVSGSRRISDDKSNEA